MPELSPLYRTAMPYNLKIPLINTRARSSLLGERVHDDKSLKGTVPQLRDIRGLEME